MSEEEMIDILDNYFEIIADIPLTECGDIAMILATQEMLGRYKKQQKEIEELKADNYELNCRINDLLEGETNGRIS